MASSSLLCVKDYEEKALATLDSRIAAFYASGADDEQTLRENETDFKRFRLHPKVLVDVSKAHLHTTVLGQRIAFPVCIAPSSAHKLAHTDGEMGTAKAAESMDTCFCLSSYANFTAADIGKATPNLVKWFQLYVFKESSVTQWLIEKAQEAGFTALVVTVDLPVLGNRRRSRRNNLVLPSYARNVNLEEVPSFKSQNKSPSNADGVDDSFTWEGLKDIIQRTNLPVVVKGILTGEDAVKAVEVGCSAVYVSNHGGRQLDGVCSSIMALPEVVQAVNGRVEVYVDGGVRTGTDILKALALGARAVFVGRPAIYSLAVEGEQGVRNMLGMLKNELKLAMQLSGVTDVHQIPKNLVSVDFTPKL